MKKRNKFKILYYRVVTTIVVAFLLTTLLVSMIQYVYNNAEAEAFESLHVDTKQIKDDIRLQIISDRENLLTMANFASKLYSDGESYDLLFKSFEPIGLIENIGILTSDNKFLTKHGAIKVSDISFSAEAAKGLYISGRVPDMTSPYREVVRSAVPITSEGGIAGILYGVMELDTMKERYETRAIECDAKLYIVERGNGNLIIDTRNEQLGNFTDFSERKAKKGFSYKKMYSDVMAGNSGYSAYIPYNDNQYHYAHYSSVGVSDWQIILAQPETVVFEAARKIEKNIAIMFALMVLIMAVYLLIIFNGERRQSLINGRASKIRKLLIGLNYHEDSIGDALERITSFASCRSAFFVDTNGEDYNYIIPAKKEKMLTGKDREYFVSHLMRYARNHFKHNNVTAGVEKIIVNSHLKKEAEDLYQFLMDKGIRSVCVAVIQNKNNNISLLGAINAGKMQSTALLLEDIAICFSMAIYNKRYLAQTESIAVTDSLTGLSNRLAYKKDIAMFDEINPDNFSCIYIDVNELHVINNKFGHAAGDGMLLYIANTLREIFKKDHIYRMGGDEFLVFCENTQPEDIDTAIASLTEKIESKDYHISVGIAFCSKNIDTETLVKEAEKRMYEAKAEYYQKKEKRTPSTIAQISFEHVSTGIREFDSLLSIITMHYQGIYCVSLKDDRARRILMPSYFKQFSENDDSFKSAFSRYVHDMVNPDYHRPILNFLSYDVLKRQLLEGNIPTISYIDSSGNKIVLSVYPLPGQTDDIVDTMWIFEHRN